MEFAEKIKTLRKEQNMTQEQLAEKLFVSRTAISKWETGRGTPGIDSLKSIAETFHISMDELLSTEELVVMAQNENSENLKQLSGLFFSLMDLAAIIGFLLPIYNVEGDQGIRSVPLIYMQDGGRYIYMAFLAMLTLCGIVEVISLFLKKENGLRISVFVGMIVHILIIFIFIASQKPYAAALYFFFLIVKGVLFIHQNRLLKR